MSSLAFIILQMKFKFTQNYFPKPLLNDLHALQRGNSCCDTRLVSDLGEIWIHRAALQIYGEAIWWTSLLTEPGLNVVLLPGVSQVELHSFVDTIYGRYQEEAEVRAKACRAPPSVLLQAEHKEDIETVVFEQIGSGSGTQAAAGGLVTPPFRGDEPFNGFTDQEIAIAVRRLKGPSSTSEPVLADVIVKKLAYKRDKKHEMINKELDDRSDWPPLSPDDPKPILGSSSENLDSREQVVIMKTDMTKTKAFESLSVTVSPSHSTAAVCLNPPVQGPGRNSTNLMMNSPTKSFSTAQASPCSSVNTCRFVSCDTLNGADDGDVDNVDR